jgi:RimJ/RimL family protein N-acetyltransferase
LAQSGSESALAPRPLAPFWLTFLLRVSSPPVPPIVHLPDGTALLLRLIVPEDREVVLEAFRRLSPDSRYYRLWSSQQTIPDSLLNRFLNAEPGKHESWAALDPNAPVEPGCGGASFWRSDEQPDRAEISLTVADECQHHGVGTILLAILWLRASQLGIREFIGHVLPDNHRMLDWMRALGARLKLAHGQFTFHLPLDTSSLKPTPTTAKLIARLQELEAIGL